MKILIVAKTRMRRSACVGGLALEYNLNVRLLEANGSNPPQDTPYEVGDIWDLKFQPKPNVVAPHLEDVFVWSGRRLGVHPDLRNYLCSRVRLWEGEPDRLFDGLLQFTPSGVGYLTRDRPLPRDSVGFWVPSLDLWRDAQDDKHYWCRTQSQTYRIPHVGYEPRIDLPRGSLIRVSLARWWRPDEMPEMEARCYLQMSGWFEADSASQYVREQDEELSEIERRIPF